MKKFFYIAISTLLFGTTTQAQIDTTKFSPAQIAAYIEMTCRAVPQKVLTEKKFELAPKKQKTQYLICLDNQTWQSYVPLENEPMLTYKGKYFYSTYRHAFLMPVQKVKSQKTPEEIAQRQQTMGTVVNYGRNLGRNILARKGIFVPGL